MNDRELAVRFQLEVWQGHTARLSELLNELTDERLLDEVSPGRNSGLYIVGHLAAVNDGMIPLLGFGEKRFPKLEDAFLKNPESADIERPTAAEVRRVWAELLGVLSENFDTLTADEWFDKHTAVSDEDFVDEPQRNRLNLLINRTNHLSYHLGQLTLLKSKAENAMGK
ncbi:MAG TPA: DinB family protein [Pyrinomonadaceae bacterium]|nr:DinB family protein [Pyrinomonadaceae bacterium]